MQDAVVMTPAFDGHGAWSGLAARGALGASLVDELLAQLLPFHAAAARAPAGGRLGHPQRLRVAVMDTLDELTVTWPTQLDAALLAQLRQWEDQEFRRIEPVLILRQRLGYVRACHGHLHLDQVMQRDGRVVVFDGIDANDDARWIDVVNELAFITMDLQAHGLAGLAHRLINGHTEATGDFEGLRVLTYYQVHRALDRAMAALARARPPAAPGPQALEAALRYLATARRLIATARPAMLLTHGDRADGKSAHIQALLEALGAIRVRSEVERARLGRGHATDFHGLEASDDRGGADVCEATYARLSWLAALVLESGRHVILDASFLQRDQRDAARSVAAELGVRCMILDFDAPPDALRASQAGACRERGDGAGPAAALQAEPVRRDQPLRADEVARVFRCRPPPAAPGEAPSLDWRPLLARLGVLLA